ncbi:uncharacterized protein A4U43_C09F14220 [Asparagus officinalis]|uniref:Uncharacterized protein n=1 Tax=Asparagus officinalis TaxID=4686 RepID=A0A5P1E7K7_ASPOF|nr:uncharacterized protein A4U43_C09F14220 [Asparagus officinalis]
MAVTTMIMMIVIVGIMKKDMGNMSQVTDDSDNDVIGYDDEEVVEVRRNARAFKKNYRKTECEGNTNAMIGYNIKKMKNYHDRVVAKYKSEGACSWRITRNPMQLQKKWQILQKSGRQSDRSSGGPVLGKIHSSGSNGNLEFNKSAVSSRSVKSWADGSNGNLEFNKSAVSSRSVKSWADELDSRKDNLDSSLNQDLQLNLNKSESPILEKEKNIVLLNSGKYSSPIIKEAGSLTENTVLLSSGKNSSPIVTEHSVETLSGSNGTGAFEVNFNGQDILRWN